MGRGSRASSLCLEARAKINLGLEVRGKRPDGYHEIRSLMQTIRLADRLDLADDPTGRLTLRCPGSDLPEDESNLVFRAALLLRSIAGAGRGGKARGTALRGAKPRGTPGARIVLHKRIPVGAGLGGGSSDAAAALAGLSRLWGLRLPPAELEDLASSLGADVPFFIRGGTQFAAGKGERLTRLPPLPVLPVLIVAPKIFVATETIYGDNRLALTPRGPLSRLSDCDMTTRSGVVDCVTRLRNDLEPIVVRRHPRVGRIMREIGALAPVVVRVSGSGSSLFVLGEESSTLRRFVGGAPVRDCRVYLTRFAGRGWISIDPRGAGQDN
jgi:4-diphosphocytidyl-2-C-methyl-D-erythritol kinase